MRYLCVHCDVSFDVDGDKPRCPRCRKTTGLELRTEAIASRRAFPRGPVAIAAIVAAVVGGYLWWSQRAPAGVASSVPLRPLEADELAAYARDRGLTAKRPPRPLDGSPEIQRFARVAAKGSSGRVALARIFDALHAKGQRRAFVPFSGGEPRDTDVRTAPRVLSAIDAARGEPLYDLELALLLASAARSVDVPAMVVEVLAVPAERSPVDPTGYRGHFGVALVPAAKRKPVEVFDLHRGVRARLPADSAVVLDDVAVLGHFLNHQSLFQLGQVNDAAAALERVEVALELAPRSAPLHGTKGAILLASGGVREGTKELERALHVRRDAPRHHNLGAAYLVASDGERAGRELAAALQLAPDFAAAHASLGALHIARGALPEAEEELRTAERLDPELASLPMLWANIHVARHEPDDAIRRALEAVRRRPQDDRARLMLASLYHELGRISDMQRELRTVLGRSRQPEQMRELIRANFGTAALEAALEPEEETPVEAEAPEAPEGPEGVESSDADGGTGGMQLGSRVLGTGVEGAAGPRLRLGDGTGLRLGGPGGGLGTKLRLGEP